MGRDPGETGSPGAGGDVLEWERPEELTPGYTRRAYRARAGGLEVPVEATAGRWRLLTFDAAGYVGGTNHRSLAAARDAAERFAAV